MKRKQLADLLIEYEPDFDPLSNPLGTKYKSIEIVKARVYEILNNTNFQGKLSKFEDVEAHWEQIMEKRKEEQDYLTRLDKGMTPYIRMRQLPKSLKKQQRENYWQQYCDEYVQYKIKKQLNNE